MKLTKTILPAPLALRRSCAKPCLRAGAVTIKPVPVVLVKDKLRIEFELKLNVPGINVNVTTNVNVWQHVAPTMRIGAVFDESFGLNPLCSPAYYSLQKVVL